MRLSNKSYPFGGHMHSRLHFFICHSLLLIMAAILSCANAEEIDLSQAVIVTPSNNSLIFAKSVNVLLEEVSHRTGIHLKVLHKLPRHTAAILILDHSKSINEFTKPFSSALNGLAEPGREGFRIMVATTLPPTVIILGQDDRGVLYGIGRFLRKATLQNGRIAVPMNLSKSSTPRYEIRGHQLGYRPKTNAYDAWSINQFDQYIREIALFGANSIEIMPPRTDDDSTSRHMKMPAMDMMAAQSRIAASYGLDVWIWYPNLAADYLKTETVRQELAEREQIFRRLPRIDALFVPAGDPGELHPDVLFAWLEKVAVLLIKYHPQAKIWVSPQAFRVKQEWFDSFYRHVNQKYSWFGGVVFGPWVKTPLPELRKIVRADIPIRHYPDITHSLSCQYPVPMWDLAFAMTLGRECYNPRPLAEKKIHNVQAPFCNGSISYSEGINDDVNKFIWSDQDWDPQTPAIETLRDMARLFISPDFYEAIAQGWMALEANWYGPLLTNIQPAITLQQWQNMEKQAPAAVRSNYRFQMGLLRACYDVYIQRRLLHETELENNARDLLYQAVKLGPDQAMVQAESILLSARENPVAPELRQHCWDLADSLLKNIGSQLSIDKHGAMSGRGNFMDNIDIPLNDAVWLLSRFKAIKAAGGAPQKLKMIGELLQRTNPGPGGFYDKMGTAASFGRVQPQHDPVQDPGGLDTSQLHFGISLTGEEWIREVVAKGFSGQATPLAWASQIGTIYDQPLRVHYRDLDANSLYRLRVCYTGRFRAKMKLTADEEFILHDYMETGKQPIYEFDVPRKATADGQVDFVFSCAEGERGSQVTEMWLMRIQ
jgi:hypothetical protein